MRKRVREREGGRGDKEKERQRKEARIFFSLPKLSSSFSSTKEE